MDFWNIFPNFIYWLYFLTVVLDCISQLSGNPSEPALVRIKMRPNYVRLLLSITDIYCVHMFLFWRRFSDLDLMKYVLNGLHCGSCHFLIQKPDMWYMLARNNVIISGNFAIYNGCSLIWHPRAIAYDSCLHRYISCPLFANALFLWWTWLAYICKRPGSWGWCSILQDWIKSGQYIEIIEIMREGCKKKKKTCYSFKINLFFWQT